MKLSASNSLFSSVGLLVTMVILTLTFWDIEDRDSLVIWFVLVAIPLLFRTTISTLFLRESIEIPFARMKLYFEFFTLLSVISLSTGLILLMPNQLPFYQSFLSIVVAGISAGAVMSLSQSKRLIVTYISILILPFTYVIYIQDTPVHLFISMLMLLFLVTLLLFSQKYNGSIITVIISKLMIEETQKELILSEKNFYSIFKEVPIGIFSYDRDLIIKEVNQSFASHLNTSVDTLIGFDMKKLKENYFFQALNETIKGQRGSYEGIYHNGFSNKDIWISMKTVPMYDINNDIKGGLGITEDITERIKSERQIRRHAFYDNLTGLANRLTLNTTLEQHLYTLKENSRFAGVLFIDIDNFKTINDSLGHHIGDELLKVFASRLSSIISKDDVVARLGGDEFVILLSDLGGNELLANHRSSRVSQDIHNLIKKSIHVQEHILHITLSIGINIINHKHNDINTIIKNADIAMYRAKEMGRNTTCFFKKEMSVDIERELILNNELRDAIKNQEFELYYQPIAKTDTLEIVSCEALIRWRHPKKGLVFPDNFIPYAEESGLILPIGDWVIERACIDYQKLKSYVKNISINISSKQFDQDSFIDNIIKVTDRYNISPSSFKLELTESVIINNFNSTMNKIIFLKSHGFIISMDDFGTGYTSLSYLKNLPFDFLKIDRSFIQHLLINKSDASLVKTILSISKQFNMAVIAEGVETMEHVKFLDSLGCEYIQGYILSKPIPLEDFQKLVDSK
jgi:diguanylate cyclase (GGDEF)-like protein/PAS domain S-box-containing protein